MSAGPFSPAALFWLEGYQRFHIGFDSKVVKIVSALCYLWPVSDPHSLPGLPVYLMTYIRPDWGGRAMHVEIQNEEFLLTVLLQKTA